MRVVQLLIRIVNFQIDLADVCLEQGIQILFILLLAVRRLGNGKGVLHYSRWAFDVWVDRI